MQINKAAVLHMYCTYEINSYPLSLSGLTLRMPLMAKSSLCPQPRWDSSFPSPFVLLLYFECSKLIWLICVLDPSTEMCRLQTVSGWFRPQILPGRSWWCCEHYFFFLFFFKHLELFGYYYNCSFTFNWTFKKKKYPMVHICISNLKLIFYSVFATL